MDKNTGGSRAMFLPASFDETCRGTLQYLQLLAMLRGVDCILLDVYRTSAYDAGEEREPTLHNKLLLALTTPVGMQEARFNEHLIRYSLTKNQPLEEFQRGLAETFGGTYSDESKEEIDRLVKGEVLTPYADTYPLLKYLTEENQQVQTVALFSNAWRYSKDEFDRVFGRYMDAIQQPGRCQVVPFYSWMTGYAKPDPRAYRHALKTFGGKPENCVILDDRIEVLLEGIKQGMKGILVIRDNNMCPVRIPEGVMVIHSFEPVIAAFKDLDYKNPKLARAAKRRPG